MGAKNECLRTSAAPALLDVGGRDHMTRVLFVGQKPETVDFSDPAIPPGFNAATIHAGIAIAMEKMAERGW